MLTLCSPAKINLFLKIIRKRDDGYHDLASLFQAIDLHDTIQFELWNKDELTCNDLTIPTGSANLILKAAHLFRQKTGLQFGIKVHLIKRIPSQAGLGGGSSNAATTLWALNQFHGYPATTTELSQWAAEIGSDISFFFSQGTAFCTGRGEQLNSLEFPLPQTDLWIFKPNEGLSTPEVFKQLQLPKTYIANTDEIHALLNSFHQFPSYFNDLEEPAFKLLPKLNLLKTLLVNQGFETVVMSGSGSALFCIGEGIPPAINGLFTSHCSFLNRSPDKWYESPNRKTK